jgi:glutamate synthase domain-containing protein 2
MSRRGVWKAAHGAQKGLLSGSVSLWSCRVLHLAFSPRYGVLTASAVLAVVLGLWFATGPGLWSGVFAALFSVLTVVGLRDIGQTKHAILRNYPIIGHLRYLFEEIRPELRQYFFEDDNAAIPFSRDQRSTVYQRAKKTLDKRPFGTEFDVYQPGFEWMTHSLQPAALSNIPFRIDIGGPACTQPYSASVFNISAMSFGALSANAIRALNKGAYLGNFAHDTGEGGFSPYHREQGGDIIWEIGSGYFGCRNADGTFSAEAFAETAKLHQVKMVEVKLSQGAKPGHGGVLPAAKVSLEIALTRGVLQGQDCVSPARHSAFSNPVELLQFVARLRELSGGKPAGFKLCIGHPHEFLAIVKAMVETGLTPDFIVIDGKEGGTGAAPVEFIDHVGMPLREGLSFAHSALIGAGVRDKIRLGASGKITTAFDISRAMALGADWCNAARGFMFAIGCIQSMNCHTDRCPVGVATQDPLRQRALHVPDKAERVSNFHASTLHALGELIAAAGLAHPSDLRAHHIYRRVNAQKVETFAELYPPLAVGELLRGTQHPRYAAAWNLAQAVSFAAKG